MSAETCPVHNQPWQLVPAGVSKTSGKPYPAFWACPERGCREKPSAAPQTAQTASTPSRTTPVSQPPQKASTATERALLFAACLQYASRVYQGSSDSQGAAVCAEDMFSAWDGRL